MRIEGIEERPHAQPVAREKQGSFSYIPDRKRKLAIQPVQALGTKIFVEMQQDLRIRLSPEAVPARLQFRPQLRIIEDLAVENDPQTSILI